MKEKKIKKDIAKFKQDVKSLKKFLKFINNVEEKQEKDKKLLDIEKILENTI